MFPRAELQSKTGHPVLMELETVYLITYMPQLGPAINTMAHDLFGLDYTNDRLLESLLPPDRRLRLSNPAFLETWKNRKREEWQALGRKYSFRLVLSPSETPLDLPLALAGSDWNFYTIPDQ